jgi:hypothetical protein
MPNERQQSRQKPEQLSCHHNHQNDYYWIDSVVALYDTRKRMKAAA